MPVRAPRICRCGMLVAYGARCICTRARDTERKAAFDKKRPSASARGYDREWRAARTRFLREHPGCAMCPATATVVDHKKPHRGDPAVFWDRSNWQSLCDHCHSSRKQRLERKEISNGTR